MRRLPRSVMSSHLILAVASISFRSSAPEGPAGNRLDTGSDRLEDLAGHAEG